MPIIKFLHKYVCQGKILTPFLVLILVVFFLAFSDFYVASTQVVYADFDSYFLSYSVVYLFLLTIFFGFKKKTSALFLFLFICLLGSNIVFKTYFGRLLMPYDIRQFYYEFYDVVGGLYEGLDIFLVPLLFYLLLAFCVSLYRFFCNDIESLLNGVFLKISFVLILVGLCIAPMRGKIFENNLHHTIVRNTLNCFAFFMVDSVVSLFDKKTSKQYKPYLIEKNSLVGKYNVVLVIGESMTYKHMGLYGYYRNTTPYLNSMKDSEYFKYYKGVSRGFSTRVGVPLILNAVYEPDNAKQLLSLQTNLFKMANNNGYKSFYWSNQKSGVLASLIDMRDLTQFYDVSSLELPNISNDFRLIEMLAKQDKILKKNPFFVVLHQRNSHFSYDENYPNNYKIYPIKKNGKQDLINSYDNSIHFQDEFFKRLVKQVSLASSKPTLIFYTSDHGELFGQSGLWGHGTPVLETAKVPILMFATNGAEDFLHSIDDTCVMSNYDLGKIIAQSLGWNIINSNESDDIYANIYLPQDREGQYLKVSHEDALKICNG